MNIEKKRIEAWGTRKGHIGHITLDKLAIPETVTVTLQGETLIPESFDCFGHPNFTKEQEQLYSFKNDEIRRKEGENYTPLEAEITYEERIFDVPRDKFDTVEGIEESLWDLQDLNKMLNNRRIFHKIHEDDRLNKFVLFGTFVLDEFGQVMSFEKTQVGGFVVKADVETFEDFHTDNRRWTITTDGYDIPEEGDICPCCGKIFAIDDLTQNPCVEVDHKMYHDKCWKNYRQQMEINAFTHQLMSLIYKDSDYHYELLPNGYCKGDCCAHIPWFLFHTIDGDIKMGWRKRVISIEWQENYKPFDFREIFKDQNVTKYQDGNKWEIHAWGTDKAYEYLKKVRDAVNPNYSKY